MPTLRERKAIREAKKKHRLAAAQLRYAEANRSAKYLICLLVAAACLITAIICSSMLMQLYAAYKYETTPYVLSLPEISEPSYLSLKIAYQGECPSGLKLLRDGFAVEDDNLTIDIDDKAGIIAVGYDTDVLSDSYAFEIKPEDNLELQYKAELEPSYRYMVCEAEYYRSESGDLWVDLYTSFRRFEKDIDCTINLAGKTNGHVVYQAPLPQEEHVALNISAIAKARKLDISDYGDLTVWFHADTRADILDPGSKPYGYRVEDINSRMEIADWPEYEIDSGRSYSMKDTGEYLSTYQKEMTVFER